MQCAEKVGQFDPRKGTPEGCLLGIARNLARAEQRRTRRLVSFDNVIETPEWERLLNRAVLHEVITMRSLFAFALLVLAAESALAADNPWVGIWKPGPVRSSYVEVSELLIISCPSAGVMRWEYRAIGFRMEGKPNGGAMSLTLPNLPKGLTETVTMLTPTKTKLRSLHRGKAREMGNG